MVVLVCSMSNLMTARAADRCRGVTCMGVFVGQGLMIQLSMDNTHSRTALLCWHHLGRGSCNRAIGRKGGTILNGSPALHYLDHPRRRLVAFLSGQDREGKPFRSPVPGFEVSWVWLTVSVVRYGSPQDAKRTHLVLWSLMSRLPPRRPRLYQALRACVLTRPRVRSSSHPPSHQRPGEIRPSTSDILASDCANDQLPSSVAPNVMSFPHARTRAQRSASIAEDFAMPKLRQPTDEISSFPQPGAQCSEGD